MLYRVFLSLLLMTVASMAQAAPQQISSRKAHLDAIPADATFFISMKAAEVYKSSSIKYLRDLFTPAGIEDQLKQQLDLTIDNIERLSIFGVPELNSWAVLVTLNKPVPYKKLFQKDVPTMQQITVGKSTVWRMEESWVGIHLIDDYTMLYSHADVTEWLVRRGNRVTGPLAEAIKLTETQSLVFATQSTVGKLLDKAVGELPLFTKFVPLMTPSQYLVFAVNVTGEPQLTVHCRFADAKTAQQHQQTVADVRLATLDYLDQRLRAINPPPPAGEAVKPVANQDASEDIQSAVVTKVFGKLYEQMKDTTAVLDGQTWKLTVKLAESDTLSVIYYMMFTTIHSEMAFDHEKTAIEQVADAIAAYEAKHGQLPPRAICDAAGKPLLSWRVAILPYLGAEAAKLYQQFKLNEPWDSEHNLILIRKMPGLFRESYHPKLNQDREEYATTRIQLICGHETAYPNWAAPKRTAIKADPAKLVLLAHAGTAVPWSKPADLEFHGGKTSPNLQANTKTNMAPYWRTNVVFWNGQAGEIPSNMHMPAEQPDDGSSSKKSIRIADFDEALLKPHVINK